MATWIEKEGIPHLKLSRREWVRIDTIKDSIIPTNQAGKISLFVVGTNGHTNPLLEVPFNRTAIDTTKEEAISRCKKYAEFIFEFE